MPSTHARSTIVTLSGEPPTLATSRELIRPALRAAVGRMDPRVAGIAGYHLGWLDAEGRPTSADTGKMLRGALVLLSAWACGAEPERGVPGAVAVELVHNFSLLHDDVMDGDERRRHRPAVWTVFGTPAAILVGDALLTLAFGVLSDSSASASATSAESTESAASAEPVAGEHAQAARCLSSAMQRLCSGQMSDLGLARRSAPTPPLCSCATFPRCSTSPPSTRAAGAPGGPRGDHGIAERSHGTGSRCGVPGHLWSDGLEADRMGPGRDVTLQCATTSPTLLLPPTPPSPACPTLARCLATAADKTAALVSGACAIGAILAAAPTPLVTALARFGEHVGLAFQLADDLLGIWGDPTIIGKPVMSDLRTRKKTIPVVAALHASTAGARRLAELFAQPEDLTDDEAAFAAELVEDAGGRAWTEAEIGRQVDAAAECLEPFGRGSPQHAELMAVAELVISRNR